MTKKTDSDDRTQYVPRHQGPTVFPNFFLFSRLLRLAYKPHLIAVKDLTYGYTATYIQLLTDVLHFRNVLLQSLDRDILARLDNDAEVFVSLLGPGGYEYTVAFFTLIALGAVIVPISADLPLKEASYFATKSRSVAVLTATRNLELGRELAVFMEKTTNGSFKSIDIAPHLMKPPLDADEIQISSDAYLDLNKPGLVIFTSGTTGPPKGAVRRRGFLFDVATTFADLHGLQEGDIVLHTLPVHHATGITVTLLPFLWAGACIEFRSGGFDVEWTWERIRQGGLNFFSGVPTIYMRMMQYYEQNLTRLSEPTLNEYLDGVSAFRGMLCGTSALPRPLQQKWMKLNGGKSILTRYGGTEFGNAFSVTPWSTNVPEAAVGTKAPGVDLKLSEGDEGEVLTRSPIMFSKYLFDPGATKNGIDHNGYFKTGDIARREGKYYFVLGRASVDIIKSGGYKLSALDIEREILGLDYIAEVMVVGVEDDEYGQRVAAAVVLKPAIIKDLTISKLRHDLRDFLAGYKMPTLLRIVDELGKNATGKLVKKTMGPELFPKAGHAEVQKWFSNKTTSKL